VVRGLAPARPPYCRSVPFAVKTRKKLATPMEEGPSRIRAGVGLLVGKLAQLTRHLLDARDGVLRWHLGQVPDRDCA
jgi:hypothetical protein